MLLKHLGLVATVAEMIVVEIGNDDDDDDVDDDDMVIDRPGEQSR